MEQFINAPWALPLLSVVALGGGYVYLLRAMARRIEILEERFDTHASLPGHAVALERIAAHDEKANEVLAGLRALSSQLTDLQREVSELAGELRASRGRRVGSA